MKSLPLLLMLSMPGLLLADTEVDLRESASLDGLVRIVNLRGEINIRGWDEPQIHVSGELDDLAEELVFEVDGKNALIDVRMPSRVNWGDGSDLEIRLPAGSRLNIEAVATELEIENVLGGSRINNVSGDIHLEQVAGHLLLRTASGEIEIEDSRGKLRASTASGDIEVKSHQGPVDIESVSGDVELRVEQADAVRVGNVSGSIDAEVSLLAGGYVDMKTTSGDVNLSLAEPDCELEVSTTSGDINNRLSSAKPSKNFGSRRLQTTVGKGGSSVTLRSVSGEITIE